MLTGEPKAISPPKRPLTRWNDSYSIHLALGNFLSVSVRSADRDGEATVSLINRKPDPSPSGRAFAAASNFSQLDAAVPCITLPKRSGSYKFNSEPWAR